MYNSDDDMPEEVEYDGYIHFLEIIKADMLIIKGLLLKYMLIGLEKFI